jgi:hypothetical protein
MKRTFTILAIILFVIAGCGGCKQSGVQSNDFITVDVMAKYPKKELILQDFLDVEYIPLETSDEFITSGYIRAIGEEIIIVNNRSGSAFDTEGDIFLFDRNGKGLRKINRIGQGGEEYINIGGIILDEDNDEMFVNSHYSSKAFVYDLFGNFKRKFGHKEGTFYFPIYNFDQDNLICIDGNSNFDEIKRNKFLIISKQDGSVTKDIQIPYKEKKSPVLIETDASGKIVLSRQARNQELIPYCDSWILVEPSSDTIYRFQPDYSITPFIVRTPSIQSMDPEVFLFPGVLTDRYYFMQAVKKDYKMDIREFPRTDLMYDRQEKTIFEYVAYNDDFSDKRPVNLGYEILVLTLVNNEVAFLRKLEAHELVEAYEEGKLKGKLKEIAAKLDEESNAVIMLAKYKKNDSE